MDTCAPACGGVHTTLTIETPRPTAFVDITDRLRAVAAHAGLRTGLLAVQTLHTTTGVVVNEHEPLLMTDFESLLEQIAPQARRYRHDDESRLATVAPGERHNGHAHCRALLLPTSVSLNVVDGRLQLGRWQRVFLVELDGPQTRCVSCVALGELGRPQ
jgi:secondary thiamine-phosphate synthase enzyme